MKSVHLNSKMDHGVKSPGFQIKETKTAEEMSHLKLQLEGSNNLVKEMEAVIYNLKTEHIDILKANADLKVENQRLKAELSLQELAKSQLQSEFQDLLEIVSSLKRNITLLYDEKENFSSILDSERNRSQQLKSALQVQELEVLKLREEIKKNKNNTSALMDKWIMIEFYFFRYWEDTDTLKNTKLDDLKSKYIFLEKEVLKFSSLLDDINQQNQNLGNENIFTKLKEECNVDKEIVGLPKTMKDKNSSSESLEATSEKCDIETSRHHNLCASLEEVNYEKCIFLNSNYVSNQIENYKKALSEIKENFHKRLLKQSLKLNKRINALELEVERKDDVISKLNSSLGDSCAAKETSERELAKLKGTNLKLQNDVIGFKKNKKVSELLVYEKNLCITQKDATIAEMKEQMSKINDERARLSSEVVKFKTCLRNLVGKLISNLTTAEYDRKVSEKEIENVLALKDGSMKELQDTVNTEIKNETFMAEKLLESVYRDVTCDKINLQRDVAELQGRIAPEKLDKSVQIQDDYCENLKAEIKSLKKELQLKEKLDKSVQIEDDCCENLKAEIKSLKKELQLKEKLDKSVQIEDDCWENSKAEIKSLKKELQLKEKSSLEKFLLVEQLQKSLDDYKTEESLKFTESEEEKIDELSSENCSLQDEMQIPKAEAKSDCLCEVNSGPTDLGQSENNEDLITKCIELLIEFIRNSECSDYSEKKKKLLSLVAKWKEDITNFPKELYDELTEFFGDQLNMGKVLESKLSNLSKAYFSFSSKICQFCESINIDPFDAFLKPYGSHIDYRSSYETVSNVALNEIIEQMHLCLNVLQLYVTSMRKDIVNKAVEIESLKGNIQSVKDKIYREESIALATELPSV